MTPLRFDGIYASPRQPVVERTVVQSQRVTEVTQEARQSQRVRVSFSWLARVAVVGISAYLVIAPYTPGWFHRPGSVLVFSDQAMAQRTLLTEPSVVEPVQAAERANFLTVPKIGVQSEVLEGVDEKSVSEGVWRRGNTSTPELGGNTVIAAHRYSYAHGRNTFYYLDKLQVGDEIVLSWNNVPYTYKVSKTFTVDAHDLWIEKDTSWPQLTLYTCTPLWSSSKRLVVIAYPQGAQSL